MARTGNRVPHHVKERLRHQKLQKMLEHVAGHIPKPATTKRETKAKKLRRVVLYMKYLIHKNEELNKTKLLAVKRTRKCQDISTKANVTSLKFPSKYKHRNKGAHIVFLTKLSDAASRKQKDSESPIHPKCCTNSENELEQQTAKNTVNDIDEIEPKNVLLPENSFDIYHEKYIKSKSESDLADRYVPNGEFENLSDYDLGLWKEDYPAIFKSSAVRKVGKSESNYIFGGQISIDCNNRKENINKLERSRDNLEQYIQEFSKDLEKMHESNSPDKNPFQSDKSEGSCIGLYKGNKEAKFTNICKKLSCDAECLFHKIERPCSFNEFVALKNYHSNCNVQVDKPQIIKPQSFSQSSDDFSLGESDTFTTLNNFEMPHTFNKSETLKNVEQCFNDIKMQKHQLSKYKTFSQKSDDLSPDFFSSGESSTVTSLHDFGKPHIFNCSARPRDDHPNYCDVKVDKHKLTKLPSFSQCSDNFSSDILSSGESGTLISSNENVLSENEHIGLAAVLHSRSSNTSPDTLLRPDAMDEDSFDYALTSPQRNCDIITSPDIFCDMKQNVRNASSNFSVDNILSKSCIKNSSLFSPNSERYLDHEPNYNVPFIHNSAYNNVADNRFINYFGMNNYSQNLPLHALPPFAQVGNYPTVNMGSVGRYSNVVPNDKIYGVDTYCSGNIPDFNHSMYVNEDMGNYIGAPIKQEDIEAFLPPEELSYSFNNFPNIGYCFSERAFNTQ